MLGAHPATVMASCFINMKGGTSKAFARANITETLVLITPRSILLI